MAPKVFFDLIPIPPALTSSFPFLRFLDLVYAIDIVSTTSKRNRPFSLSLQAYLIYFSGLFGSTILQVGAPQAGFKSLILNPNPCDCVAVHPTPCPNPLFTPH